LHYLELIGRYWYWIPQPRNGPKWPILCWCAVKKLVTHLQKSIAQYPIQPNTSKYWAIPNTPMLVSF